jgi:hypothetical protein
LRAAKKNKFDKKPKFPANFLCFICTTTAGQSGVLISITLHLTHTMNPVLRPSLARIITTALALQALPLASSGAVLLYDGFAAGASNANGQYEAGTGGRHLFKDQNPVLTGFSGAWVEASGASFELGTTPLPSLSYTDGLGKSLLTSGNAAFRRFNNGVSSRALNVAGLSTTGTTAYFSFLMKLDDATALGRVEFAESSAGGGGGLRIRTDGTNIIATVNFASTTLAATNTNTHFFVFKVDFGASDVWSLWMNPADLTTAGAPTLTGTVTGPESLDLTHLMLMRETGGTAGSGFLVDEIRIGTTWDSVTPVPEPSTYVVLVGLLALGVVALRRRAG